VAEAVGASGGELLTAVVVGYEVALRVGRALGTFRRLEIPHVQVNQGFGAVAAACKLLGLDREAVVSAFGVLGGSIRGTPRRKRELQASGAGASIESNRGMYALQGVLAALQAGKGLSGASGILDGDRLWTAAGADGCLFDQLTLGLGEVYRIMEMSFKPTPTCRDTQPALTGLWQILEDWPIMPEEIEEILVKGRLRLMGYDWENLPAAQSSTPCALAMSLIGGELPGPRWYTTGRYRDPDVRSYAQKVRFEWDPEAEELYDRYGRIICTVTVRTRGGDSRTVRVEHVKGGPGNPLTEAELVAKFRANASPVIDEGQIGGVLESFGHWADMEYVSSLMKLLGGGGGT
jgi:2-methylcitrate dehydratase PrpD